VKANGGNLTIGALSGRTGVNIETIRYYERIGVLRAPARSGGGHRLYDADDLKRLTFIRRSRDLGFSLVEVRALLNLADQRSRSCAKVRDLATGHLEDVRAKLADLRRMERILDAMVTRCADGTLPECPLIDALFRGAGGTPSRSARGVKGP
jgi:MerR family mercuric resistance operon transcriptional regulator